MKTIHYLVLFVLATVLAATTTSCKKDETSANKKDLLTAKSWKMSSSKINGVTIPLEDCEKDDVITFSANGTWSYSPGSTLCYEGEALETGTWSLSADEKTITVDSDILTIIELTDSKLVVQQVDGSETVEQTLVAI